MTTPAGTTALNLRPKENCRWDLVSLGEVMLRLDPGDGRVATTRKFDVWEGGGSITLREGFAAASACTQHMSPHWQTTQLAV